jgi:diguanylate cyclase (GGDEF)-like protein/PAS domain S-box-containing protein
MPDILTGGGGMRHTLNFFRNLIDNLYDGVYFVDRSRTITYWNKGAERLSGFAAGEVIGSCCHDNILVHMDFQGRMLCGEGCPLTAAMEDGSERQAEIFLRHKDGHRLPVLVRVAPIRDSEGCITGAVEIFSDNSARMADLQKIDELQQQAFFDPLTGLANRRYMELTLQSRLEEMARYGWRFGVLFLDVDHFKRINDQYGHETGDAALKMVAKTIAHCSRSFDTVGRWGGEEFVAIVVGVDESDMLATAERYRQVIAHSALNVESEAVRMTVSIGATLAALGDTAEGLVKRADELMYKSKLAGRDCVTSDQ